MATMKEFGLIFEDISVKVVEVVVNKSLYESFCTNKLQNELWEELQSYLKKNNCNPTAILPDTAYHGCNYRETIIRDATNIEKKEYLMAYEELQEYLMDFPEERHELNELDSLIQSANIKKTVQNKMIPYETRQSRIERE